MEKLRKYGSVKVISRIKTLSIQEGYQLLNSVIEFSEFDLSKDRLRCFLRHTHICASCSLEASFFAIEYITSKSFSGITINLYGVKDNKDIFFTKDHIKPKSLGGEDCINNYQTMCWRCNSLKGNSFNEKS